MNISSSYPLAWPIGRNRTNEYARKVGPNQMHGARVRQLLNYELEKMVAQNVVISSNVAVRRDGLPYANQRVDDPGVVLYFNRKGEDIAISCDAFQTVDANLRAIGLTIEAIRGMERWGTEEMVDRAFTGFKALPEAIVTPAPQAWWQILELPSDARIPLHIIRSQYRYLAKKYHPDNQATGDTVKFNQVKGAFDTAEDLYGDEE